MVVPRQDERSVILHGAGMTASLGSIEDRNGGGTFEAHLTGDRRTGSGRNRPTSCGAARTHPNREGLLSTGTGKRPPEGGDL